MKTTAATIGRAAALALISLSWSAQAASVTGAATVTDGDTIEVGSTRVRPHGIDAPESAQRCHRASGGGAYGCGDEATVKLMALIGGKPVTCEGSERAPYGRLIGTCTAGDVELNRTMVREGQAWAFAN